MSKSLSVLFAEFDDVIEKRAAEAKAEPRPPAAEADDVVKLAQRLVQSERVKTASAGIDEPGLLLQAVRSIAITDTLLNMPMLQKIAAVEERARAAGATDQQVEQFFEKNASAFKFTSVLQQLTWLF